MSQSPAEIAKEITITAIEKGVFHKKHSANLTAEEHNQINAEEINKFFKSIAKQVNDVMVGKFD